MPAQVHRLSSRLGVVPGFPIGRRYVRPTNAAQDARLFEGHLHLLLFTHGIEDTPPAVSSRDTEPIVASSASRYTGGPDRKKLGS